MCVCNCECLCVGESERMRWPVRYKVVEEQLHAVSLRGLGAQFDFVPLSKPPICNWSIKAQARGSESVMALCLVSVLGPPLLSSPTDPA